jgi:hypothetical protein
MDKDIRLLLGHGWVRFGQPSLRQDRRQAFPVPPDQTLLTSSLMALAPE